MVLEWDGALPCSDRVQWPQELEGCNHLEVRRGYKVWQVDLKIQARHVETVCTVEDLDAIGIAARPH